MLRGILTKHLRGEKDLNNPDERIIDSSVLARTLIFFFSFFTS